MTTITISDDSGQLTVSIDGGEPEPIQNAEDACQVVEQTFAQQEESKEVTPEQMNTEGLEQAGMAEQDMAAGFNQVRGGGLNG